MKIMSSMEMKQLRSTMFVCGGIVRMGVDGRLCVCLKQNIWTEVLLETGISDRE